MTLVVPPQLGRLLTEANDEISQAGLLHAADLALLGHQKVAASLYAYGRQPLSPRWAERFPNDWHVLAALAGPGKHTLQDRFGSHWTERAPPADNPRWYVLAHDQFQSGVQWQPVAKIYINLPILELFDRFGDIAELLHQHRVPSFKIGRDLPSLLRADKFVAYLDDFHKLPALVADLNQNLAGQNAQQLPFTAAVGETGVVSCGFDPPSSVARMVGATSWRSWVTAIASRVLLDSRASSGLTKEALAQRCRVQLEELGVDCRFWAPRAALEALW